MIEIRLYRHAESERNLHPEIIGGRSTNTPLSENGLKQAKALGEKLLQEQYTPSLIVSSPALRCIQTSQISMDVLGICKDLIIIRDGIQELDQGVAEGGIRLHYYNAETLKEINSNNHNFKFDGGESQKEVEIRMLKALEEVKDMLVDEGRKKATIFTHGMAMRCLLRGILDYPARSTFFHTGNIKNAHGMELIFDEGTHMWKLSKYNC